MMSKRGERRRKGERADSSKLWNFFSLCGEGKGKEVKKKVKESE